ncbi:hypothetical protein EVAR_66109_1 [Eumeta japonica]|uniref:Uncharacterized protein n=1 Tax=Eumeta variegata TaxID=151549 RepID=A0A4C2AB16_EUMVA|nr:hypothetical protein EVAR_66109_1 [Eumeta japonica]
MPLSGPPASARARRLADSRVDWKTVIKILKLRLEIKFYSRREAARARGASPAALGILHLQFLRFPHSATPRAGRETRPADVSP